VRAGAERAEVTVEQVVRELKLHGFSDIRKVVSWRNELVTRTEKGEDGEPVMVLMPRVTIVDADKISDEAAAAVAEVSQTVNGALRVKLHDKHAAVVSIGKHLGMFTDIVQMKAVYGVSDKPMSAEEPPGAECTRPLARAGNRPCDRAGGALVPASAARDIAAAGNASRKSSFPTMRRSMSQMTRPR
jgi:hypothetical protein